MFDPIAIVGRGCVLPDALSPDTLWANILARRVSPSPVSPRRWGLDPALAPEPFQPPGGPSGGAQDTRVNRVAGQVRGFAKVWDPAGLLLDPDEIAPLDRLFHWTMHCCRQALGEAGLTGPLPRAGLVLGNVGYPAPGTNGFAERVWSARLPEDIRKVITKARDCDADPRDRFCSGLPAHLTARALGLGGGTFALDAACASSLYAMKFAVDRLHDGTADVMLAAAVNGADDLFLHAGFGVLGTISRTGRSRPLSRAADGLVPAEGAACVALMRLADAVRADMPILAVVRGIGLSNDGRGQGLLAPSEEGQRRAVSAAYHSAGIDPASVTLLECHATGTRLGDAVEVQGMANVFSAVRDLPVGSVKSNLGHPVTVAGLAGLLKLVGAMRAGVRPATLGAEEPNDAFAGTALRPLCEHEPWEGRRRAGLSTFGFGGNNAHLVLDEWPPRTAAATRPPAPRTGDDSARPVGGTSGSGNGDLRPYNGSRRSTMSGPRSGSGTGEVPDDVAIVAIGARVGTGDSARDLADGLFAEHAPAPQRTTVTTPLLGLRFPPSDLRQAHAQQLLIMDAAREALAGRRLPRERTMVLVGMACDPEVGRFTARWRAPYWLAEAGADSAMTGDTTLPDAFAPPLTAAGVVGTMPNMVANRLNSQFDLAGPGFSVFAEEASGLVALRLGCHALRSGEADAVLVGAVDLSCEPVHQASLRALGRGRTTADAAVALLLRRRRDAERDGEQILALVDADDPPAAAPGLTIGPREGDDVPGFDPVARFGSAHAAEGLLAVAVAALAVRHRAVPRPRGPADPLLRVPVAEVTATPLAAPDTTVRVRGADPAPWSAGAYAVHLFQGRDRGEIAEALRNGHRQGTGPCRLTIVERPGDDMAARREAVRRWLSGQAERPPAVAIRDRPLDGEIAFVYANGSACYPGMGRALMLGFPELVDEARNSHGDLARLSEPVLADGRECPVRRNLAATLLADLHTRVTRDLLGIRPDAVLGYSSGEGSAVIASGMWHDVPALVGDLVSSGVFTHGLVGEQRIARRAWRDMGLADDRWINLLVAAPIERVREALRDEKAAFLLTVNAPGLCVVGGAERACERLTRRLGTAVTVAPLGYDIAAHAPVLGEARDELRRLYHRTVRADGTARFYTGTTGRSYVPTSDTVAETLTTMTLEPVDFAATVRNVWDDGVRLFVEHGPRDLCSRWISATLQDRDHLTVALDGGEGGGEGGGESGAGSFAALAQAVAELAAAGVVTASGPVLDRLGSGRRAATAPARSLVIPAHPPAVGESPSSVEPPPAAGPPRSGDRAPDRHRGVRSEGAVTLDRTRLEQLAAGKMSEVFDDRWTAVDERARRTRMPEPPMLLADRVLDIDAEPFSMRGGTIWTETDIGRDAWYLDGCGRIPAGLLVEAGQADLLLLSWLGVDLHVDDDRVYRLLGCDLTFHGSPPGIGATCRYEIGVDGHGRHGDVHLFFFHSRCDVEGQAKLTVTNGQAGYFTDEELAASQGVLWEAAGEPSPKGRVCLPAAASPGTFGFAAVRALSEGRPDLCFGRDWRITRAHLRTPRIGHGRLRLLHRVPVFDPRGGPWKRGYLRAEFSVSPQEWFFPGHFTNDPCMPGTLMLEGCLQAMAFYLTACGFTLDRDGWRFEPVPETSYELRCRGQVTPRSRLLTYELFVSEVSGAPEPALHADALCTVDGVKAFHARGLGLRLVPDSPFAHWSRLTPPATQPTGEPVPAERLGGLLGHRDERPAAVTADGRRLDHPALLAAAWGTPAEDGGRVTARLPGPPYLFVSRITEFSTTESACVTAEYDVPRHAWYWEQSGSPAAPLAVLVEIAQQPCAWLLGQLPASAADRPARLRYLGGTMTVLGELSPSAETVRTTARLTGRTRRGTTTVHTFSVTCHADGNPLLSVSTSCALLPAADTAWPDDVSPAPRRAAPPDAACSPIDLRTRPPEFFAGRPRLPGPMLLMIDRLTGRWPDGGARGLGRFRAEREIDPADWYFRAHHFQDPVLPGSLVIEAMGQLLQISMLQDGAPGGRFCSPPGHTMTWTHHGQVTPACDRVILDMEITQVGADAAGRHAVADAWLWAGGSCVCQAHAIAARIVPPPPLRTAVRTQERTSNTR